MDSLAHILDQEQVDAYVIIRNVPQNHQTSLQPYLFRPHRRSGALPGFDFDQGKLGGGAASPSDAWNDPGATGTADLTVVAPPQGAHSLFVAVRGNADELLPITPR